MQVSRVCWLEKRLLPAKRGCSSSVIICFQARQLCWETEAVLGFDSWPSQRTILGKRPKSCSKRHRKSHQNPLHYRPRQMLARTSRKNQTKSQTDPPGTTETQKGYKLQGFGTICTIWACFNQGVTCDGALKSLHLFRVKSPERLLWTKLTRR